MQSGKSYSCNASTISLVKLVRLFAMFITIGDFRFGRCSCAFCKSSTVAQIAKISRILALVGTRTKSDILKNSGRVAVKYGGVSMIATSYKFFILSIWSIGITSIPCTLRISFRCVVLACGSVSMMAIFPAWAKKYARLRDRVVFPTPPF